MKDAYPVWAGGRWKRTRHIGHLASGLPVLHISREMDLSAVRLWLLCDRVHVVVLAWDPSPLAPVQVTPDADTENGRGLLLVEAISEQWGWYFPAGFGTANIPDQQGKVVWAVVGLSTNCPAFPPAGGNGFWR